MTPKTKRWMGFAGGAVLLALVVWGSLAGGGEKGERVYVEPVQRRDVKAVVSAPGQVDPRVKVNISAHVIGKIERLYFEEGDLVQRGDRLVDLERVTFQAANEQAQSILANRRIDVQRSRINLENAKRNLDRAQSLSGQGIMSDELLDRARLDYQTARTALASAEEAVRQAEAAVRQSSEDLQRTSIVAPISGRIVQKNAQEGEVVITGTMNNPGSVIAVLADLSEVLVEAEVGETEVVKVQVGQPAEIRVDAMPGETFQGSVAEIGSSATQRAGVSTGIRYFKVKVGIHAPDARLRPGMTAQVDIVTEAATNALTVPVQSVVERNPQDIEQGRAPRAGADDRPKEKYVFVVANGKAEARKVQTGISNATHVVVTAGLSGDESVVTGPFRTLRNLKNGQAVTPESEDDRATSTADEDQDENDEDES